MNLKGKITSAAKFRMRVELPLALVAIALAALPAFAQRNQPPARAHARRAAELKPSPAVEQGQKTFASNCAFCHGEDATGGRGPDLVRSTLVAHDVNGNLIGPVILNGRPDKGMPPQHLSDAQIADIAAFLHFRQMQGVASARLPSDYNLKWLLTGSAAAGKDYFNGAGGCKSCHSPAGDLAHVASKYSPLELESRMLYPRGEDRRTVTVTQPSGETVEGPLEHIDEFNVAVRDSSGWYRSFPRDQVKVAVHDPLEAHRKLLDELTQADIHNLFAYMESLK